MIASVALFAHRRASKLAAPNHECVFQHSTLLEVRQQSADRLVHGLAESGVVFFDSRVRVPLAARTAVKLDEPHTALGQPSGQQTIASKRLGLFLANSVERFGVFGFLRQIDRLRCLRLHAICQFVAADSRFQFGLLGKRVGIVLVESSQQGQFRFHAVLGMSFGQVQVGNRLASSAIDANALM